MIKYVEYDSFDEYGQHIIPVNDLYHMNKVASGSYSPELMKVILNMKRHSDKYYVVINALGSYEIWGCNRNGDAFPEVGLIHKSLRTDMGTPNDYGYKTFEYYAKLYKHHVNKDPNNSFGDIIFSHWNPLLHRVELIVAINVDNAKDIIDALEKNEQVAVSMGCFIDPTYPILTKDGYKQIKDIVVGDIVFTHNGNWKKVTELHRRKYTGKVYTVKVRGLPLPLELTADHPMMMKNFQKQTLEKSRAYNNPEEFESKVFDWSHIEHAEVGDHIQYMPVSYNQFEYHSIDDEKLSKLMGYYFAEGSFIYNNGKPCTIQLSCHIDDDLPREIPKLINDMFPNTTCSINPHHNSDKGLSVDIHSTRLACFMNNYMSHLAKNKKIPPEVFVSALNVKLSFVGAWISGDGWCDEKGVHISSCNINALLQARDLLINCGIPSSLYKIKHKAGDGFSTNETIEYTLNISHLDAEPLIPYCHKKLSNLASIISEREKEGNSAIRLNADGTYSYSISSVEFRDENDIQTYNFEVEDDESYIAAGMVSHNCKVKFDRCNICGNKASTREKYCKHAKNHLREIIDKATAEQWSKETGKLILPGTQVFVYNDYPRFFDISRVFVGADRISYVLGKAASKGNMFYSADIADAKGVTDIMIDKLAMVKKEGDIDKEIGGALGPQDVDVAATPKDNDGQMYSVSESDAIRKSLNEKINGAIINEPQLPNNFLDSMASSLPLETIFSTLFGLGIHPKPVEFQRIVLVKIGQKPLADELESNNTIFDYKDDSDVIPINFSNSDFSDTLGRALTPFLQERSCFPSMLGPRIRAVLIKTAQQNVTVPWPEPEKKEMKIDPKLVALSGLAALFAGLKMKAMGYGPRELADFFANKPWLQTLVGGSIVWKLYDEINKKTIPSVQLIPASEYNRVLPNTHFSGHFVKQATDIHAVKNALGLGAVASAALLPTAYIANAWNQKSVYQTGRPALPLSKATEHPKSTAIAGGLLATGATYYAPKMLNNIRSNITKVLKK